MVTVKSNIIVVVGDIETRVSSFVAGPALDSLIRNIATSVNAVMKERIHEKGEASDGSLIGQYSTKPTYISLNESPKKFVAKGKNSESTIAVSKSSIDTKKQSASKLGALKNGRIRRSGYFPGGYNQFKTEIGRNQLGSVNLSLSGQLNNQLAVQATAKGYGLGWPDAEKLKRAKALEKKYGKKIWALANSELELVKKIATKGLINGIA